MRQNNCTACPPHSCTVQSSHPVLLQPRSGILTGSAGQLPRTADMLNSAGHTRWSALTRIYWMWWGTSLILDCRNGTELRANQKLSIRFYSHRRGSTDTFLLYLKLHLFQTVGPPCPPLRSSHTRQDNAA